MAYTPTYSNDGGDLAAVIIDLGVGVAAEWVGFVALIAIALLGVFLVRFWNNN